MALIQRFLTSFRGEDDGRSGLIEKNDATIWYRKPDGSEAEIGNGGASPFVAATVTLTDAQIKALPTTPAILVPATETLNYSGLATTLPCVVSVIAFLDSLAGGYTNLDASAKVGLAWGSDQSQTIAYATTAGGTPSLIPTVFAATTVRWLAFPLTDANADSKLDGGLQDNALAFVMENSLGALTGGNAANTLKIELIYRLVTP